MQMVSANAPKTKPSSISIILKIAIFAVLYAASMLSAQGAFNLMSVAAVPSFAASIISSEIMVQYIVPIFVAMIYFAMYFFVSRIGLNTTYRTMYVLGEIIDLNYTRVCLDIGLLFAITLKLLAGVLFMYVPIISAIAKPLLGAVIIASAVALSIGLLVKKYGKKYLPIVFNCMVTPIIVLCVFA